MVYNFIKKKLRHRQAFFYKSSKIFKETCFVEHIRMNAWMKWTKKNCIYKIYSQEDTGEDALVSAVPDKLAYSFS